MRRRRFLQIAAAAALVAPGRALAESRWQGVALGAEVSIVLRGDQARADRALPRIVALLAAIEAEFSLFADGSTLSRLNAAGRIRPSAAFLALARAASHVHSLTNGLFDPTIQPLWRALAEDRPTDAARAAIGWRRVKLHETEVRLAPGQAITFNGIAQGYAADRVRDLLAEAGFTEALVDMGEFAALGGRWSIGIEDPVHGLLGRRRIDGTALATSSPGAMSVGGMPHILAPDGRAPLWSTVTVEARNATLADGLSTALCFLDASAILRLKAQEPAIRSVTVTSPTGDLSTF